MGDLLESEPHPQEVVVEEGGRRVVTMDSARYVDASNTDHDVVVAASYIGVLPARLMAPHRPRAVIGHDGGIGKDAAGIQGLYYLEALGIPAVAADGATDPSDTGVGTKVRREVVETSPTGRQVVVTDSIIFARPEDRDRNVLVTAGHTGRSGASFLLEFRPWGFICSDGGGAKNDSGTAGLAIVEEYGLAGASVSAMTAAIGDAQSSYVDGIIAACNEPARRRGVEVGMSAKQAAHLLLAEVPTP